MLKSAEFLLYCIFKTQNSSIIAYIPQRLQKKWCFCECQGLSQSMGVMLDQTFMRVRYEHPKIYCTWKEAPMQDAKPELHQGPKALAGARHRQYQLSCSALNFRWNWHGRAKTQVCFLRSKWRTSAHTCQYSRIEKSLLCECQGPRKPSLRKFYTSCSV